MTKIYLLLLAAAVIWKGYYAFLRGIRTWRNDRRDHDTLREYLLANGATQRQALWPFRRHALQRAFLPLLSLWKLWTLLAVMGLLVWWIDK